MVHQYGRGALSKPFVGYKLGGGTSVWPRGFKSSPKRWKLSLAKPREPREVLNNKFILYLFLNDVMSSLEIGHPRLPTSVRRV